MIFFHDFRFSSSVASDLSCVLGCLALKDEIKKAKASSRKCQILCDATFIHHLLVNRITPDDTTLSNILGAPVKMFTTMFRHLPFYPVLLQLRLYPKALFLPYFFSPFIIICVLAELKSLGEAYSDSLNVARDLAPARCDHEKRKNVVACLTEYIVNNF